MRRRPTFSWHELRTMLRDLSALVATPEGRQVIAEQLEAAVRRSKAGGVMLDKIRLMYDYFRDPAEPWRPKIMIGAALLYLIVPSDVIPDWFGLIGFADDFAAIAYVFNQTRDVLTSYDERRQRRLGPGEAI
ncbi:MAG: YkvA family protein [Armatimonadota bacterium]